MLARIYCRICRRWGPRLYGQRVTLSAYAWWVAEETGDTYWRDKIDGAFLLWRGEQQHCLSRFQREIRASGELTTSRRLAYLRPPMTINATAEAAHRAASAAVAGGASLSAGSGAWMYFSPAQWQVIGIVGGLVIGVLGLVVNAAINVYFKQQELKLKRAKLDFPEA